MAVVQNFMKFDSSGTFPAIKPSGSDDVLNNSLIDFSSPFFNFSTATNVLAYTDNTGKMQSVDLSGLVAGIVSTASYADGTLTLVIAGDTLTVPLSDLVPINVNSSPTVLLTGDGTGVPVTAVVKISASANNALVANSDGLYVTVPASSVFTSASSVTIKTSGDGTIGSPYSPSVNLSTATGNLITLGADGIQVTVGSSAAPASSETGGTIPTSIVGGTTKLLGTPSIYAAIPIAGTMYAFPGYVLAA